MLNNMTKEKKTRNLHYPIKAYRLAENTIKAISVLKERSGKSYNLLFLDFIAKYQKANKLENKKQ
jgi:hypothetical protein